MSQSVTQKQGRCRKVRTFRLDNVSTTCVSGWVDDEYAYLLTIERPQSDPPATAGGTDRVQV